MPPHYGISFIFRLLVTLVTLSVALNLSYATQTNAWRFRSNYTGISCSTSQCPLTTVCNPDTKECDCANDYLVAINVQMPCLMRKYPGELCIHSLQCAHIDNAVCISNSKRRNELRNELLPLKDILNDARKLKHPEKYLPYKEFGRCECRPGYWPNQNHQCELKKLGLLECTESHHCPDPNSYCDLARRRCACELGHMFDSTQNRCRLNVDMVGVFCQTDLDCQVRDEQLRCWMGICTCINYNRYDFLRGCGPMPPCKNDQVWNHFSKSCEPTGHSSYKPNIWNNLMEEEKNSYREWTHLSAEVWFKLLIFFLFVVLVLCVVTRRKACIPPNLAYSAPAPLGRNSGRNAERHNMSGPMSLSSHMHAIHLRVNLSDEIERGSLMSTTNRRPSQVSSLSLPTYESLDSRSGKTTGDTDTSPPPSYDQLPSYEEAISEPKACAKDEINRNNCKGSSPVIASSFNPSLPPPS